MNSQEKYQVISSLPWREWPAFELKRRPSSPHPFTEQGWSFHLFVDLVLNSLLVRLDALDALALKVENGRLTAYFHVFSLAMCDASFSSHAQALSMDSARVQKDWVHFLLPCMSVSSLIYLCGRQTQTAAGGRKNEATPTATLDGMIALVSAFS